MNINWEKEKDNKSIFYSKITNDEYKILISIMESNDKFNRKLTSHEINYLKEIFKENNIKQNPQLKMWFDETDTYSSKYYRNIFGATLKTENFTMFNNNVRGKIIDSFKWDIEINRAYLISNSEPKYLAIIGYRRDFDIIIDKVQQLMSTKNLLNISKSLRGISWTLDEIENLADTNNVNIIAVDAKNVSGRSDTLSAANFKAQDVRNVDLYKEIRPYISNVRILFEEGTIEMDLVGKIRTVKHTTDNEKMDILGKYFRK